MFKLVKSNDWQVRVEQLTRSRVLFVSKLRWLMSLLYMKPVYEVSLWCHYWAFYSVVLHWSPSRYLSTGFSGRSICTPEVSGVNGPDLVPQDSLFHLGGCELWSTTNVALSLLVNSPQLIPWVKQRGEIIFKITLLYRPPAINTGFANQDTKPAPLREPFHPNSPSQWINYPINFSCLM